MFYYEQMFNTALNGIMTAGLMSTILTVAYGILLGIASVQRLRSMDQRRRRSSAGSRGCQVSGVRRSLHERRSRI